MSVRRCISQNSLPLTTNFAQNVTDPSKGISYPVSDLCRCFIKPTGPCAYTLHSNPIPLTDGTHGFFCDFSQTGHKCFDVLPSIFYNWKNTVITHSEVEFNKKKKKRTEYRSSVLIPGVAPMTSGTQYPGTGVPFIPCSGHINPYINPIKVLLPYPVLPSNPAIGNLILKVLIPVHPSTTWCQN